MEIAQLSIPRYKRLDRLNDDDKVDRAHAFVLCLSDSQIVHRTLLTGTLWTSSADAENAQAESRTVDNISNRPKSCTTDWPFPDIEPLGFPVEPEQQYIASNVEK